MNLSVTLIIPTLNRSKLLKRALQSVLNQTIIPKEIIVVDNGSRDSTKKMIERDFENIKYIYHNKKGVSKARNVGIKSARNELICFLDSDDEWCPKKIEKQVNFFSNNNDCKFLHTNEIWFQNGYHLNQLKKHMKEGGYIFENCLKICCISPSSTMIHKSLFEKHGLFDEELKVCEDYEMWLRVSSKEKIFFLKDKLVVKHGGHLDQLSKKYWGMDRFRVKAIEKNINNNYFSKNQNLIAIDYLLEKIKVILGGAKKRKNIKILNKYQQKYVHWTKIKNEN